MTKERRAEIAARLQATTKGEWGWDSPTDEGGRFYNIANELDGCYVAHTVDFTPQGRANIEFCVDAHNRDIPDLLDTLDVCDASLSAYREALGDLVRGLAGCQQPADELGETVLPLNVEIGTQVTVNGGDLTREFWAGANLLGSPDPAQDVVERLEAAEMFSLAFGTWHTEVDRHRYSPNPAYDDYLDELWRDVLTAKARFDALSGLVADDQQEKKQRD